MAKINIPKACHGKYLWRGPNGSVQEWRHIDIEPGDYQVESMAVPHFMAVPEYVIKIKQRSVHVSKAYGDWID